MYITSLCNVCQNRLNSYLFLYIYILHTKPGLRPEPSQAWPSQGLWARLAILVGLSPGFDAQARAFRPSPSPHITSHSTSGHYKVALSRARSIGFASTRVPLKKELVSCLRRTILEYSLYKTYRLRALSLSSSFPFSTSSWAEHTIQHYTFISVAQRGEAARDSVLQRQKKIEDYI